MAGAFSSQTADSALQILNVRRHLLRLVSALFLLTAQAEVGPASARMEAADQASAVAKSTPIQPSRAVPAKPSDANESPFRITLPEGAIVELIGVSEPLSADHAWWRPDGSPLTNPPVGSFEKKFRPRRIAGSLLREFAVNSMIGREAEVSESRFTPEGGLQLAHSVSTRSAGEKIHEKLRFVRQIRANSRSTIVLSGNDVFLRNVGWDRLAKPPCPKFNLHRVDSFRFPEKSQGLGYNSPEPFLGGGRSIPGDGSGARSLLLFCPFT